MAQSVHCAFSFSQEHPEITKNWINQSNYICILEAQDEKHLIELIDVAKQVDIKTSIFREPDIDDQITAIALSPGINSKKICSNLRLALKEK